MSQVAASRVVKGLRLHTISDPEAARAAALFQLSAGSFDEPARWPGLAHLLEHVLFAGSRHYQQEARLMAWAPANGARLNATTLAHSTAWFVETAPEILPQALARLSDMLAQPLLAVEAVEAEAKAIEAEYRMLQSHEPTLSEAALSQAFASPHPVHDFHVGSLRHFGKDAAALRQALAEYHRRFFHSGNLQLWLIGPQPLAELDALAEQAARAFKQTDFTPDLISSAGLPQRSYALAKQPACAAGQTDSMPHAFPLARLLPQRSFALTKQPACAAGQTDSTPHAFPLARPLPQRSFALAQQPACAVAQTCSAAKAFPPARLLPQRSFALRSAAAEELRLSFLIDGAEPAALSLLRELLLDKAKGSLLATLRELALCDDISLLEPYRGPQQSILSVVFQLSGITLSQCARIEETFCRWLAQLPGLPLPQLAHYVGLTQRRFARLSSLDKLRELAFGIPPAQAQTRWQALTNQLSQRNIHRMWISPAVEAPAMQAQGFTLNLKTVVWPEAPRQLPPALRFYSPSSLPMPPALPAAHSPLDHLAAAGEPELLLSVRPDRRLARRTAARIEAALQPVMGEALHHGGELGFSRQHGVWLLRLRGGGELLATLLDQALQALAAPASHVLAYGERLYRKAQRENDIAIRQLLARLPDLLATETVTELAALRWQAALYGGEEKTAHALARLLTKLPGRLTPRQPAPEAVPPRPCFSFPTVGKDAAVLLFCPLPDAASFTSWQLLAALFEPRFFQRLRVEQNIGYVVSCRFHQTAGQAGLLFALQSPSLSAAALFQHIELFITAMAEVIGGISAEALSDAVAALRRSLPAALPTSPEQVLSHWLMPSLDAACYQQLAPQHLRQAYRQLIDDRGRRWYVSNDDKTKAPAAGI